ncbi:transposase [Bradyrhizobium sp. CCBAU 53421]|uniref:transposase n=1 Tax=Bradyrhizobium sp. CCBAU 53421 TaxID=1325120 RepID=UPI00188D88C9
MHADQAASWDNQHERFEIKGIKHQKAHSLDGACTDMAAEHLSRLRRAETGIHHDGAGAHLLRHAQEPLWREDKRRVPNGKQVNRIAGLALVAAARR